MNLARLSFAVIALAVAAENVQAQELSDRQKGRILARQVCAECHAVRTRDARSPNSYAPSFVEIAAIPGMTGAALNFILHNYHQRMPNFVFNADQTNAIVAYILSLKR